MGRRISFLNPSAPEFHPLSVFHRTYSSNVTNFNYNRYLSYISFIHNFPNYSPSPVPLPPPLPASVELPHNLVHPRQNYQYYPHVDHHHHHQHLQQQANLNHGPNSMQMTQVVQPQPQMGLPAVAAPPDSARISPTPSPVRPNSPASGLGEGGARRTRRGNCRRSRSSAKERKQGFELNGNDWKKFGRCGGERHREFPVILPVKPYGSETTAMIRNIPNQYTREMLIKFLDEFCCIENQKLKPNDDHQPFAYDFLYLPIDFERGANKGYAFVNFTHPTAVWKLHLAYSSQGWKHCKSPKICGINCAAIQGKDKLVEHFGKSNFVCNHDYYLPVCFSPPRDGSGASVAETTIGHRVSSSFHLGN